MRSIRRTGKSASQADVDKPSIETILDHYGIRYSHRAGWQKILCPFHDESVPSCTVNIDAGAFNCHACGAKGGDSYAFVMLKEQVDFPTTLRLCSEITGIEYGSIPRNADGTAGDESSGRRVSKGAGYRPKFGGALPTRPRGRTLLSRP